MGVVLNRSDGRVVIQWIDGLGRQRHPFDVPRRPCALRQAREQCRAEGRDFLFSAHQKFFPENVGLYLRQIAQR